MIENNLTALVGYIRQKVAYSDYVGIDPVINEKWVVEAKRETTAIGLEENKYGKCICKLSRI